MKITKILISLVFLIISVTACSSTTVEKQTQSESIQKDSVSAQYVIGDIILADGSVMKETGLTTVDSSNIPIAVIAGYQEDGTAFGVGVHRSDTPLQWAEDGEKNYPAFDFADTYASTYDLNGDYTSGWYMPSIAELRSIYQNREAVNISLQKIYELDNNAAMDGLDTNWYWSSSQSDSEDDYAWFVHFFNGYAGECPKNFTNVHALAVRTF